MKKILLLLPTLLLFSLSACVDYTELEQVTIASMLCIDRNKNGHIEMTTEVIDTSGDKPQGRVISVTAPNLATAMYEADVLAGQPLYWSHTAIIVLGQNLVREDFSSVLQHLEADKEIRINSYVLIAKDMKPQEILEDSKGEIVGFALKASLKEAIRTSQTVDMALYNIVSSLTDGNMVVMSSITKEKTFGTAAVLAFRLVDYLTPEQTHVFLRLQGDLKNTILATDTAVFEVLSSKTDKKIRAENGNIFIDIKIHDTLAVLEYSGTKELYQPEALKILQRQAAEEVAKKLQKASTNLFLFGDVLRLKNSLEKRGIDTQIKEDFTNLHFNFVTDSTIVTTGFLSTSIKRGGENE